MRPAAAPDDLDLLLVDGDNLLHAVRGRRDEGGTAWLLPNLARWRPAGIRVVVILDGHPAPAEPLHQRAYGIELRHAGSRSADDVIVELLAAQPYAERSRSAVVTRDRALKERVRAVRAQTRTTDWLLGQIAAAQRPAGAALGDASGSHPGSRAVGRIARPRPHGRTEGPAGHGDADLDAPDGWRPGRGATRKRGNPRRTAKRSTRR